MRIVDTNTGTRKINGQATSGRVIRDLLPSEDSTVSMPTVEVTGSPSSVTQTVEDANYTTTTAAITLTTTDVNVTVPPDGYSTGPVTYASSNPAVATVDADGNVTPVSAGTTIITATIPGLNNRRATLSVVQSGGEVTTTLNYFVSGSLGAHLVYEVNALIGSQTPPPGLPLVNPPTYPPPSGTNVNIYNPDDTARNTGVWTGELDLTCIPQSGQGVLIALDTVAFATHVGTPPRSMTFIGKSGTLYPVTLSADSTTPISDPCGDGGDITIGVLTSGALPSWDFEPAQLMPATFRSYLPQPQFGYPLLFTNQDKTLLLGDLVAVQATATLDLVEAQSQDATRATWWYAVRVGDSGNPAFHAIDTGTGRKLVLATLWHSAPSYSQTARGPIYADNISQINAVMSLKGSGYTVSTVDLSGFTAY